MGEFGEKFRIERERRGFTLDEVSNVTKIGSRMLQAIEEERFELLPGGVFNKGFVRAYAKHLGFNDQEAVTEYLAALRQAQVDAQTAVWDQPSQTPKVSLPMAHVPPTARGAESKSRMAERHPLSGLGFNASTPETRPAISRSPLPEPPSQKSTLRDVGNPRTPLQDSLVSQSPVQRIPAPAQGPAEERTVRQSLTLRPGQNASPADEAQRAANSVIPSAEIPAIRGANPANGIPQSRHAGVPWKIPALVLAVLVIAALLWNRHSHRAGAPATSGASTATSQPAATAAGPERPAAPNLANPPASVPASEGDSAKASNPKASNPNPSIPQRQPSPLLASGTTSKATRSAPPRPKAPAMFRLAIRASENSWISIAADGQEASRENLIAPANITVRASRQIVVRVGNAAGVSFLFNDKEVPAQGLEAEAKTFIFDNSGMRTPQGVSGDPIR